MISLSQIPENSAAMIANLHGKNNSRVQIGMVNFISNEVVYYGQEKVDLSDVYLYKSTPNSTFSTQSDSSNRPQHERPQHKTPVINHPVITGEIHISLVEPSWAVSQALNCLRQGVDIEMAGIVVADGKMTYHGKTVVGY